MGISGELAVYRFGALDEKLEVGEQSRLKLLTLWSDIATTGQRPLYAQLFLTRSVLKTAPVFDHPLGQYLTDPTIKVNNHFLALQGALGLTADEIGRILADSGKAPESAELSLTGIACLYPRRSNILRNWRDRYAGSGGLHALF
jgi:hypothetical protein